MNVCRTTLLRRALATSAPARSSSTVAATSSRTVFANISSSSSYSCTRSPASSSFFSTSSASRNAAAPADAPSHDAAAATPAAEGDAAPAALSSCPEGTVLVGLNYTKGKADPVALRDEEYPSWLWNCLEVMKKAATEEDADAGDEFSKSKKQRRMALRRQRELEAKVLATGDLTALAPKIPLQHQSVNLPVGVAAAEGQTVSSSSSSLLEDTLAAADKRKELRVALRKERRAKIKESNYLRSM